MRRIPGIHDMEDSALDGALVECPPARPHTLQVSGATSRRGRVAEADADTWTRDVGPVLAELVLETFFGRVGDGLDRAGGDRRHGAGGRCVRRGEPAGPPSRRGRSGREALPPELAQA